MLIDPEIYTIYAKAVQKHSSREGLSIIVLPSGEVFSCQPNGEMGTRPAGADGGYESCVYANGLADFCPVGKEVYTFAVRVIGALL